MVLLEWFCLYSVTVISVNSNLGLFSTQRVSIFLYYYIQINLWEIICNGILYDLSLITPKSIWLEFRIYSSNKNNQLRAYVAS